MQVAEDEIQLLLNELKSEEQKYETNSVAQKELDDISVICFTTQIESIIDKLFHVSVKICDSLSDIDALEICSENQIDRKFSLFVIQIFVSNVFQNKLISTNWIASVSIQNSDNTVYKTVYIKNLIPSNVFNISVPFSKSTEPALVKINLFLPSKDLWSNIKISTIETDISYHFIPFYEHKMLQSKRIFPLFQISKLYTDDIRLKANPPILNYRFDSKIQSRHLFESVLKNCVHKLDINYIQTLTNTDIASNIKLSVNESECSLNLDTTNNVLKISGSFGNLFAIKKFLTANMEQNETSVSSSFLQQIRTLRMRLHEERCQNNISFDNLKMLYEEYKNLIAELPI